MHPMLRQQVAHRVAQIGAALQNLVDAFLAALSMSAAFVRMARALSIFVLGQAFDFAARFSMATARAIVRIHASNTSDTRRWRTLRAVVSPLWRDTRYVQIVHDNRPMALARPRED